ncbi:MAG: hypothetical protein HYR84_11745 [Planctomycetes bacterium]|nr:hypothetical protein [Planctomycetota bacterium]
MPTVSAMGDPFSILHDHPLANVSVLSNDYNDNAEPLTAAIKIYDMQVGTLSVEDADYLDTASFALVDSTSYPDNAYFAIEDDQLVVAPEATLSPGSYVVQVQATDGAGATATQTFTITVDNVTVWIDSVQDAIEGESTGYFRLKRSSTEGELTVPYTIDTAASTAEPGIDYAPLPLYVTFADGQQYADIVIDPTGDYANAPNDLSKSVFIQLTDLPGGVGVKQGPGGGNIVQIAQGALAPPVFTQPNGYTIYAGERTTEGQAIGRVDATLNPSFRIIPGPDSRFFGVHADGVLYAASDLPLGGQYTFAVRAQRNWVVSADVQVTVILKPLVLAFGDTQGVAAPIGANAARRDTVNLTFVRIANPFELAQPLTVTYSVWWNGFVEGRQGEPGNLDVASQQTLLSGIWPDTGSVTIPASTTRVQMPLTVQMAPGRLGSIGKSPNSI